MSRHEDLLKDVAIAAAALIFTLLALRFVVSGALRHIAELLQILSTMDAAIVVAMVTGCVSIVTVVSGSILNNAFSYRQKEREYLRSHREETYCQLIAAFTKVFKRPKVGSEYSEAEMMNDIFEFTEKLMLWGSADAIKLWSDWRIAAGNNPTPQQLMLGQEQIIMQLRKDMGQKERLPQGSILKLFIIDVDEALLK